MFSFAHPSTMWCLVLIQLIGFACLLLARLGERLNCRGECQLAFFLGLALVGFVTVLSLYLGNRDWIVGCGTLAVMVVGASIDFKAPYKATDPAEFPFSQ